MSARLPAFAVALLAGLAQAGAIASPWDGQPQWWLQILALSALAAVLQRAAGAREGAALAWVFAIAWLGGVFWWLFISMHVYGGLPSPLAALAVLALAAFLGLYYAAAGGVFVRYASGGPFARAVSFAGLWLLAELMRASWFTGFPWGASGYAHVDGPLAFLAPWIGVYGVGAVAALIACALAAVAQPEAGRAVRHWLLLAGIAGLLAACNYAALRPGPSTNPRPPLSVALLQGNIPQDEKFGERNGVPFALAWYAEQLAGAGASLVVTPETAIPLLPQRLPAEYLEALRRHFARGPQAALVSLPLGNRVDGYTNSVIALHPGREQYRYDKHHLVPFGEFIPPFFKWFTEMMNIPLGDFDRGAVRQASFAWRGERLAPNICYEDLFGEDLAARFADGAANAPTVFVNMSNIAWFGDSIAIDQHLHISRMRALEFDRPMIRATNTGATAIIDRAGRVTHSLPRLTRGVLTGEVQGSDAITPYAAWLSRLGLWPLWLLGIAVLAALLGRAARRPATPP
ncbi:MAG: apolipoprotein N-acyltransferase [Ramlibacter sp.]